MPSLIRYITYNINIDIYIKIFRSNTTLIRIQLNKSIHMGVCFMRGIISHNLPVTNRKLTGKQSIEERAISLAHYIIDSKDTVRGTAAKFGISKSTVHKDVSERLCNINPALAQEVREILDENKAERHIRGGMATKLKYSNEHRINK